MKDNCNGTIRDGKNNDHHKNDGKSMTLSIIFLRGIFYAIQKKLKTPLAAVVPGIDAGLMIVTTIGSIVAYTGTMIVMSNQIKGRFVQIITDIPRFDFKVVNGVETGNDSWLMYSIFSDIALSFFVVVFLVFGMLLALKQAQLVTSDTLKAMVKSAFFGIIIIMIFPYIWDPISDISEMSAQAVLNPLHSFDDESPCIASSDPRTALLAETHLEMLSRSTAAGLWEVNEKALRDICKLDLRSNYLYEKAFFGSAVEIEIGPDGSETEWWNLLAQIDGHVRILKSTIFETIFLGVAKSSMVFFLSVMAGTIGSMRYLLTDIIAISLPILLVMRCFPMFGIDKLANTLTTIFVPLLFVPFFTALIISAGSTSLLMQESNTIFIEDSEEYLDIEADRFAFWVYAVAILALAVMTPVMFVPMLGSVANTVGQMVMTGTMSGVMAASQAAMAGAGGGASAASGVMKGSTGAGMQGALKSMFSIGSAASIGAGIAGGAAHSVGSVGRELGSGARIAPGAGGTLSMPEKMGEGNPEYEYALSKAQARSAGPVPINVMSPAGTVVQAVPGAVTVADAMHAATPTTMVSYPTASPIATMSASPNPHVTSGTGGPPVQGPPPTKPKHSYEQALLGDHKE